MEDLRLAVAQMRSVDRIESNEEQIFDHLSRAEKAGGVDIISFPENSLYMRIASGEEIPFLSLEHPSLQRLSAWAQKNGTAIHLGSIPLKMQGGQFAATVLVLPDGKIYSPYQKIHLFDVDVAGIPSVRESRTYNHGHQPAVWIYKGWKIGLSICYDLRFSELYKSYRDQQVELVLVPSSFTVPTGQAHWEILQRARAIELQAYVAAAAQGGSHTGRNGETRETFGHSMIVDPWGRLLAEAGVTNDLLTVTLKKAELERVRRQIPMHQHRRL